MAPKDAYQPNPFDVEQPILTGEYSKLSGQFDGVIEPPAITEFEAFETWSHKQIHDALTTAPTNQINATALSWRGIYTKGSEALPDFTSKMQAAIDGNWQGASGAAAAAAIGEYTRQADQLLKSILMVANDLDQTEAVLVETLKRVGEPIEITANSNATLQESASEFEAEARRVMRSFYQPGVTEVDGRTPRLPEPQPVGGASAGGDSGWNGTGSGGADATTGSSGGSGGPSPEATRAASTASPASAGSPPSVGPPSAGAGPSHGGGAGAGGGSSAPSPSGGASAAGLAGGAAAGALAAPRSSGPLARPVVSGSPTGSTSGSPGSPRNGAPVSGMYPPAGRGRGDDAEGRDPSAYLVAASNTSELVGELPMTTQPVIGE